MGCCAGLRRSIPACAGEPWQSRTTGNWASVYPRVCGGTQRGGVTERLVAGLSPRVRGNLAANGIYAAGTGSIPACAGEPFTREAEWPLSKVYPRVCGGTEIGQLCRFYAGGLSPRVRGNLRRGRWFALPAGSIPACAGEPSPGLPAGWWPRVYPRVCGGTWSDQTITMAGEGLSPRVRGNLGRSIYVQRILRSIPACAGEPVAPNPRRGLRRVYPRVCGGTTGAVPPCRYGRGLSPRVRGNLPAHHDRAKEWRSIPACAGEPRRVCPTPRRSPVYPRVCGGTSLIRTEQGWAEGLSPRVRGNRQPRRPR